LVNNKKIKLLIITGMSGAGKSQTANVIEDMGFYCVDNMPPVIIPSFVSLFEMGNEELNRIAVVTDIRGGEMFSQINDVIKSLENKDVECKILFLDASDEVLINRYRANRRTHPLCDSKNLSMPSAVQKERKMLASMRERADYIIDTSSVSPYELKSIIADAIFGNSNEGFSVLCKSFGFKNGIDSEADLMFDVRCLPNPFYIDELKNKTGLQKEVKDYIFGFEQSNEFLKKLIDFIDYAVPLYVKEGKSRLVISIGCTGGKHRSVAFAELICKNLIKNGYKARTMHRDINK